MPVNSVTSQHIMTLRLDIPSVKTKDEACTKVQCLRPVHKLSKEPGRKKHEGGICGTQKTNEIAMTVTAQSSEISAAVAAHRVSAVVAARKNNFPGRTNYKFVIDKDAQRTLCGSQRLTQKA